jgi:hypothetical protein
VRRQMGECRACVTRGLWRAFLTPHAHTGSQLQAHGAHSLVPAQPVVQGPGCGRTARCMETPRALRCDCMSEGHSRAPRCLCCSLVPELHEAGSWRGMAGEPVHGKPCAPGASSCLVRVPAPAQGPCMAYRRTAAYPFSTRKGRRHGWDLMLETLGCCTPRARTAREVRPLALAQLCGLAH